MEEQIETRASAAQVWQAWGQARTGQAGDGAKKRYRIVDVKDGESFSILWKSLFVRLLFRHKVTPTKSGSLISYSVQIGGLFGWAVRRLIGNKIRNNLSVVLKTMVKQLEN